MERNNQKSLADIIILENETLFDSTKFKEMGNLGKLMEVLSLLSYVAEQERKKIKQRQAKEIAFKTYSNWFNEILNSFDIPYTNSCIEGFNNKIKVLKRNAFGFRNFDRFRNRIFHCRN